MQGLVRAWIPPFLRECFQARAKIREAIQDAYGSGALPDSSAERELQDVKDLPDNELPEHSTHIAEDHRQHYSTCEQCRQVLRSGIYEIIRSSLKKSEDEEGKRLYTELFESMLDELEDAHPGESY